MLTPHMFPRISPRIRLIFVLLFPTARIGGRIIAFQTGLPSSGPGKLKKREDPAALGTPKEKLLYTPQDNYYTKLAKQCAQVWWN